MRYRSRLISLMTAAFISVGTLQAQTLCDCRGRCSFCVDGICIPNRATFGYYEPRWRRWPFPTPNGPPRYPDADAGYLEDRDVELPTPQTESDINPEFPHRMQRPSSEDVEATLPFPETDPFQDDTAAPFEDDLLVPPEASSSHSEVQTPLTSPPHRAQLIPTRSDAASAITRAPAPVQPAAAVATISTTENPLRRGKAAVNRPLPGPFRPQWGGSQGRFSPRPIPKGSLSQQPNPLR